MKREQSFHRLHLLTGTGSLISLKRTRVIIFGVGGVGSWCAEALIRSGVGHLTLVDSDLICITNINRQVQAKQSTVGKVKVIELANHLAEINPEAEIVPVQAVYDRTTCTKYDLSQYDYVIDAIDSLSSKVELIIQAVHSGATLFSALGASCRLDPARIKVASIWDSERCKLGRFVRKRLRRRGFSKDFLCVYSDEDTIPPIDGVTSGCGTGVCVCPKAVKSPDEDACVHEWCSAKKQINGSAVHVTGTFGFFLSGLVVQDVIQRAGDSPKSRNTSNSGQEK
jgi:tRNA A37 threonylcarbamoyladenosine dehydratase